MLGLPQQGLPMPQNMSQIKEFEKQVLNSHAPLTRTVFQDKAVPKLTSGPEDREERSESPLQHRKHQQASAASDTETLLQGLFRRAVDSIDKQTPAGQEGHQSETVSRKVVQEALSKLEDQVSSLFRLMTSQQESVQAQLEETKHKFAVLQAEFQSKFETDKSISLVIPNKPSKRLLARQDSNDSANSFMPLEGESSEDYKLRELERKAEKLQQELKAHGITYNLDSDPEEPETEGAIPGIDGPLEMKEKATTKVVKESPVADDGQGEHRHNHSRDTDEHHEHTHGHEGTGRHGCGCRRRGEITHRHLVVDTHQVHYGL